MTQLPLCFGFCIQFSTKQNTRREFTMGIIDYEDIIHMAKNKSLITTEKTSKTSKSPKKLSKPTISFAPKILFVEQPQTSSINTLKTTKKSFDLGHTSPGRPGRICNM